MGAFVTLHELGELRAASVIWSEKGLSTGLSRIWPSRPRQATQDFLKFQAGEIDKIEIEISVLSPMKKVSGYEDIKIPGDGLCEEGLLSGVYLPQVADETGWARDEFLTSLCAHKAGLAPDAWKDRATEIYVFTAEVFGEKAK